MNIAQLQKEIEQRWPGQAQCRLEGPVQPVK